MASHGLHSAMRIARAPSMATLAVLENALSSLRITKSSLPAISYRSQRDASHQAQGRANGAKDGPGKRLGAKKTGGQYVVPGNILFKQRGTLWFPGENCFMGRDHTIHAGAPGYVRYYRDPARHPDRKYIGVVFEKDQSLPTPPHAVRRRKLGMLAFQMPQAYSQQETGDLSTSADGNLIEDQPNESRLQTVMRSTQTNKRLEPPQITLRPGYQYRYANWEIGRAGERKEAAAQEAGKTARTFAQYKPANRFAAWRKKTLRRTQNLERKQMGRGGKGKK